MASQRDVARHLSLSQQAVSKLVAAGVLPHSSDRGGMDLDRCRGLYIAHLREVAAGRSAGDPAAPNLVLERARLARAQAVAQERKNAEAEERVIDLDQAAALFLEVARHSRDAWRAWPSRVAPHLAAAMGLKVDVLLAQLDRHVHDQLLELGDREFADTWAERPR